MAMVYTTANILPRVYVPKRLRDFTFYCLAASPLMINCRLSSNWVSQNLEFQRVYAPDIIRYCMIIADIIRYFMIWSQYLKSLRTDRQHCKCHNLGNRIGIWSTLGIMDVRISQKTLIVKRREERMKNYYELL